MKLLDYNINDSELIEEFDNVDDALFINSVIVDDFDNIIYYCKFKDGVLSILTEASNITLSFKESLISSILEQGIEMPDYIRFGEKVINAPKRLMANTRINLSKNEIIKKLYKSKQKFELEQGMSPDLVSIMTEETQKGNPKALLNNQWCRNLYGKLNEKIQNVKNDLDYDYDFSSVGSLPYSAIEILELNAEYTDIMHIILVEVFYDPDGIDDNNEWLVMYNPTNDDIDITGYTIEVAGVYFKPQCELPKFIIPPNEYFIIGGSNVMNVDYTYNLSMQNGGKETDGVRILNSNGMVLDTILYNLNNTNSLPDDLRTPSISFAPDVNAGESLIRRKINDKYLDTNSSAKDFEVNLNPDLSIYKK